MIVAPEAAVIVARRGARDLRHHRLDVPLRPDDPGDGRLGRRRGAGARRSSPRSAPATTSPAHEMGARARPPGLRRTRSAARGSSSPTPASARSSPRPSRPADRGAAARGQPRRATSDHQVETVGWLRAKPWVHVADDEAAPPRLHRCRGRGRRRRRAGWRGPRPAFIARIRRSVRRLMPARRQGAARSPGPRGGALTHRKARRARGLDQSSPTRSRPASEDLP